MKLLHLASEYPPAKVYGLGRFVHGLARAQAAQGDDVHVLTNSHGGREDDVVVEGVHLHRIAFPNPPRPSDGHGEVLQWNHGVVSRLLDRRAALADVDVIVAHDWLTAIAAREAARILDRPVVATVHDEVTGKHAGALDRDARYARDLEALLVHDAALVLANSEYVARQVVRHYGVDPAKVAAVHGGIDPTRHDVPRPGRDADFRAALCGRDELLVAYVGRLDAEKGLGALADAIRRVTDANPAVRFALAGSGQRAPALETTLGDKAQLLGYVKGEALSRLQRVADVALVPSLYEPFGLVALEAMLAGSAVVVADSGGLPEIVRDGQDGLVVPAGDPAALADAVLRLVRDHRLRRRLGEAGEARARTDFSWEAIARRTRTVYERVLGARPAPCVVAPALPPAPTVDAVLVTRDAPLHARAALRSLVERTRSPLASITVVDHGSTAANVAQLRAAVREVARALDGGREVSVVEADASHSPGQALLLGLAEARGDLTLLVSDETEVPPGADAWLEGLAWLLEERGASSTHPTLVGRADLRPDPLAEPRRLEQAPPGCLLARRSDLLHVLLDGEGALDARLRAVTGRPAWAHPTRLVHAAGEARREPGAAFAAAPDTPLPASIVVVAYDGLAFTRAAIEAVLASTPRPFELVLVDNGSTDGTLELFRELERSLGGDVLVQLVENGENRGYPVAANQGVRAARGRHVVLLNNDTQVRPGWLEALLNAARAETSAPRGVGLVTAKILNLDGSVQSAGGIEHRPDGSFTIPLTGEDRLAPPVQRRREVTNAGGPCLLVTRAAIDRLGERSEPKVDRAPPPPADGSRAGGSPTTTPGEAGRGPIEALARDGALFDEAYSPAYFEDSDLCLRAREAGFALVYEPGAEVFHVGKATSDLVAREGTLDVWSGFERNKRRFHERWAARLAADAARVEVERPRRRVLLSYHRSATTTAAYCEAALRREHDVVTLGRDQDLDLGRDAPLDVVLPLAAERLGAEVELVLAIEGETLLPPGLEDAPCPTALWAIDNHLHAATDDGWHLDVAPSFDHVFAAQRSAVPRFLARGARAHWLPLAADPEVHAPHHVEKDLDVVFVGNVLPIHRRRRALLDRLARRFRTTSVRGVFREDMARLFSRAKVVWNCSLAGDLNMRVFEALAAGSCLVTDRAGNGLQELFEDGGHLALYDDEELEDVVAGLLADGPRRARLAERGRRLVLGHHTYAHRMRELIDTVFAGGASPRRERRREGVA